MLATVQWTKGVAWLCEFHHRPSEESTEQKGEAQFVCLFQHYILSYFGKICLQKVINNSDCFKKTFQNCFLFEYTLSNPSTLFKTKTLKIFYLKVHFPN